MSNNERTIDEHSVGRGRTAKTVVLNNGKYKAYVFKTDDPSQVADSEEHSYSNNALGEAIFNYGFKYE